MSSEAEYQILEWTSLILTSFSFLGEVLVIWAYYRISTLRSFHMRLVNVMVISLMIYTLSNFMMLLNQGDSFVCDFEGLMREFGGTNSVFYAVMIGYTSYHIGRHDNDQIIMMYPVYRTYILTATTLIAFVPLFGNVTGLFQGYGMVDIWCGISNGILNLSLYYSVAILGCIVTFRFYWKLYSFYKATEYKPDTRLFAYPAVLFISWLPPFIDQLVTVVTGQSFFILKFLHIVAGRSQGLSIAIVYGTNNRFRIKQIYSNDSESDQGFDDLDVSDDGDEEPAVTISNSQPSDLNTVLINKHFNDSNIKK